MNRVSSKIFSFEKTFFIICFVLLLVGCKKQKSYTEEVVFDPFNIDINSEHISYKDNFLLSEIAKDIKIIPLELNQDYLFRKIKNIIPTEDYLFIGTSKNILMYDINGKFIREISQFGQGPEEYYYCSGIGVDSHSNLIYITSGLSINNEILIYDFNNRFIGKKKIAPTGFNMTGIEGEEFYYFDNKFIFRRMLPFRDNSTDYWLIQIQDNKREIEKNIYNPAHLDRDEDFSEHGIDWNAEYVTYWGEDSPLLRIFDNNILFKFSCNDTIYLYNSDTQLLESIYAFELGDRPDFEMAHKAVKDDLFFSYWEIHDFFVTTENIFVKAGKREEIYLFKINKITGSIEAVKEKTTIKSFKVARSDIRYRDAENIGFINDVSGGPTIYPDFFLENKFISLFYPEELLDNEMIENIVAQKVVDEEKKKELLSIISNLQEDDNPILFIIEIE